MSVTIRCYDRAVVRFFAALGAPVGSKIIKDYSLPTCFSRTNAELRKAFFDGLLASEVSIPRFEKSVYKTDYFKNFSMSLSKAEFLENEHIRFMNSVKTYLKRHRIKSTKAIRKDIYREEPRKDGHYSNGYRIFFSASVENVKRFNRIFPLRYAKAKKEKLEEEIKKATGEKPWHTLPG